MQENDLRNSQISRSSSAILIKITDSTKPPRGKTLLEEVSVLTHEWSKVAQDALLPGFGVPYLNNGSLKEPL